MTRGNLAERLVPLIALALGLGHAVFLGGLATPVTFSRAVLAIGVLCPLMMGVSSTRIGRLVLRPQTRQLLPYLFSIGLGPALALVIGRCVLHNHPDQATTLLLLSLLPGSALAPVWVNATRASGSTVIALSLIGWSLVSLVSLPLFAGSFASAARLVACRDLLFLCAIPLAVGGACRVLLSDVLEPEEYARDVEPVRQTVLQASFAVLLFTSAASDKVALVLRGAVALLPALGAVALLYLGLIVGCGGMLLVLKRGSYPAGASATLLATTTRQTALAISALPLVVAPSAVPSALAVPLFAFILELVVGAAAFAWLGSRARTLSTGATESRDGGRPSIVPE